MEVSSSIQTTLRTRTSQEEARVEDEEEDRQEGPEDREDLAEGQEEAAVDQGMTTGTEAQEELEPFMISSRECRSSRKGPSGWKRRSTKTRIGRGTRRI